MKSISIILPLHEYSKEIEKRLEKAIGSIGSIVNEDAMKVIFVGPEEVIKKAEKLYNKSGVKHELSLVVNDDINPFVQINKAVMSCTTTYFSVLEFDDEYKPMCFKNVEEYINANERYSMYIPLNQFVDKEGKFVSLSNEIAWASSFSDNLGFLDVESLELFMDFNVTGAVIKTEDFITVGGLKPSLKVASWYEFLLRMCYNSHKVFIVPRIGYVHTIGREDSFMLESKKNIRQEEGEWLITTAKQEYFFKEDRNKVFEKEGGE